MMARADKRRPQGVDLAQKVNDIIKRLPKIAEDDPGHLVKPENGNGALVNGKDVIDGPSSSGCDESESDFQIATNPSADLCMVTYDARRPPLFAIKFPDLFVCS